MIVRWAKHLLLLVLDRHYLKIFLLLAIRIRLSPVIYAFKRMILCFADPLQRSGDEEDGPEGM